MSPRPIPCRYCGHQLFPQQSPLDYAASKRRLCGDCYSTGLYHQLAALQDMQPHGPYPRRLGLCEHLFSPWEVTPGYILGIVPPTSNHDLYTRKCELCGLDDVQYSILKPTIPAELDISWAHG